MNQQQKKYAMERLYGIYNHARNNVPSASSFEKDIRQTKEAIRTEEFNSPVNFTLLPVADIKLIVGRTLQRNRRSNYREEMIEAGSLIKGANFSVTPTAESKKLKTRLKTLEKHSEEARATYNDRVKKLDTAYQTASDRLMLTDDGLEALKDFAKALKKDGFEVQS